MTLEHVTSPLPTKEGSGERPLIPDVKQLEEAREGEHLAYLVVDVPDYQTAAVGSHLLPQREQQAQPRTADVREVLAIEHYLPVGTLQQRRHLPAQLFRRQGVDMSRQNACQNAFVFFDF